MIRGSSTRLDSPCDHGPALRLLFQRHVEGLLPGAAAEVDTDSPLDDNEYNSDISIADSDDTDESDDLFADSDDADEAEDMG